MTRILWLALALMLLATPALAGTTAPGEVKRMSIEDLQERLGDEKIVVVDTRSVKGWDASATKIKGAARVAVDFNVPAQVRHWKKRGYTYVLYCA